jgi:tRNA-specific 2-thiouridylase
VKKDLDKNILYVAQGEHPALYHTYLKASQLSWCSEIQPELPLHCKAKVRYRQDDQSCTIHSISHQTASVEFDKPLRAITPGQSVVFYQADNCLGGGIIDDMYNT